MRTFFRILTQARLKGSVITLFILSTLLYVCFNLLNFSALIPILEVLFNEVEDRSFTGTGQEEWKQQFYNYLAGIIEEQGKMSALVLICILVFTSVVLANLFRYIADMCLVETRLNIIRTLRRSIFRHLVDLPLASVSGKKKGDLIARVMNDIQEIETSVVYTMKVFLKEPIMIVGYLVILFTISPRLSLYSIALIPVAGIIISGIARKLKRRAHQSQEVLGEMSFVLDQMLSGIKEIKSFGAQKFMTEQFEREIGRYASFSRGMGIRFQLAGPVSEILGVGTMVILLLIGGSLVLEGEGELSASRFIAFLIIFSQVLAPAKALSQAHSLMQRGIASGSRVFEIIDESEVSDPTDIGPLEEFRSCIEFEDVSFSYGSGEVLSGINLRFDKGRAYAITGSSGSGKSTLVDLISRFHNPTGGRVLLDGNDIRRFNVSDIRRLIAVVGQDTILFNDTLRNNLTLGREVSDEEIDHALTMSYSDIFIGDLPDGLNTIVGERGSRFSGGERQRIAIARAILKDAPILILDEATSFLDRVSEEVVMKALRNLMKGRTTILVSHQKELIKSADIIFEI